MRKVVKSAMHVVTVSAAMALASLVVLSAGLYLTGFLTSEKVSDVVKVLDGRLASPPEAEVAEAEGSAEELGVGSEEELEKAVQHWREQRRAEEETLASAKEAVELMRRELEMVRGELDAREQQIEKRIATFESAKSAAEAAARDEGFQTAVKNYTLMDSADVADLLYELTDSEAVRYLKAFKNAFAAEVLTEIKKIDEKGRGARGGTEEMNRATRLQEIISGGSVEAAAEVAAGAAY